MEIFYPTFLSRKKAMAFTGFSRNKLENIVKTEKVKTITTKCGHKRYFRDDLLKLIYVKIY